MGEYLEDKIYTLATWTNSDKTQLLKKVFRSRGLEEVQVVQGGRLYQTCAEGAGQLQGGDQ